MSKKEEYFCIFTSCFKPSQQQEEVVLPSQDEIRRSSIKNDNKISLKHVKHLSINSSLKPTNQRSILLNQSQRLNQHYQYSQENGHLSSNRAYNSPCQRRASSIIPLNGMLIKTAPNNENSKRVSLLNSNEFKLKTFEQRQLDKTTKYLPQNFKQSLRSSHLKHLQLQQTKILKKANILSNLDSYKQSVVSIDNQNESVHQRLQESMIVVDYFNPPQEMALQFQRFLVNR